MLTTPVIAISVLAGTPRPGAAAVASPSSQSTAAGRPPLDPPRATSPARPGDTPSDDAAGDQTRATPKATKTTAPKPATTKVPTHGSGGFRANTVSLAAADGDAPLFRVRVRVEKDLAYDPDDIARAVSATLNDDRSWPGMGKGRFAITTENRDADLTIYLATPDTTDRMCYPLRTLGEVSCRAGHKVILNAKRWAKGAKAYGGDVAKYRQYLVNHEVGHFLGYGHVGCPVAGAKAPVMMQQTKGVGSCKAYPWPKR